MLGWWRRGDPNRSTDRSQQITAVWRALTDFGPTPRAALFPEANTETRPSAARVRRGASGSDRPGLVRRHYGLRTIAGAELGQHPCACVFAGRAHSVGFAPAAQEGKMIGST